VDSDSFHKQSDSTKTTKNRSQAPK